jgi:hypothetical protein
VLPVAAQPRHRLDESTAVVDLDVIGVQAGFDRVTDQP